jgi:hypothetical protein
MGEGTAAAVNQCEPSKVLCEIPAHLASLDGNSGWQTTSHLWRTLMDQSDCVLAAGAIGRISLAGDDTMDLDLMGRSCYVPGFQPVELTHIPPHAGIVYKTDICEMVGTAAVVCVKPGNDVGVCCPFLAAMIGRKGFPFNMFSCQYLGCR